MRRVPALVVIAVLALVGCASSGAGLVEKPKPGTGLVLAEFQISENDRVLFDSDAGGTVEGSQSVLQDGDRYSWGPIATPLQLGRYESRLMVLRVPVGTHRFVGTIVGKARGGLAGSTVRTSYAEADFAYDVGEGEAVYLGRYDLARHPETGEPTFSFVGMDEASLAALAARAGIEPLPRYRIVEIDGSHPFDAVTPVIEKRQNSGPGYIFVPG